VIALSASLIAGLLFIALHGVAVLVLLGHDAKDLLRRPYLVFGLGTAANALIMFLLALTGLRLSLAVLGGGFLGLVVLAGARRWIGGLRGTGWRLAAAVRSEGDRSGSRWDKAACAGLLAIILVQLVCAFFTAAVIPESSFDGRSRWALKANVLHIEGGLAPEYFRNPDYLYSHPYYPLLVPLEVAELYFFMGERNDSLVKVLFALYLAMLLHALFDTLRGYTSFRNALFFTALLGTVPILYIREHATKVLWVREGAVNTLMADIPLSFYSLVSVILFLNLLRQRDGRLVPPLALALFGLAFTKLEGLYYAAILTVSYALTALVYQRADRLRIAKSLLGLAACFLLLYLPWGVFRVREVPFAHRNFPESSVLAHLGDSLHRVPSILLRILEETWAFARWHIVWPLFGIGVLALVTARRREMESVFLLLAVLGYLCFLVGTYAVSTFLGHTDERTLFSLIEYTVARLLLHGVPIAILFAALSLGRWAEPKWK